MEKLIPFFEVDGQRYELKPTKHLYAEYKKLQDEVEFDSETQVNAVKIRQLHKDLEKYEAKVAELETKFFDTFDEEDERRYLKAKELYYNKFNELAELEANSGNTQLVYKKSLDVLENITIIGIADEYFDHKTPQAREVWEKFVDDNGQDIAIEWLSAMAECLFIKDEEEAPKDSFLAQMRKRQQANRKK